MNTYSDNQRVHAFCLSLLLLIASGHANAECPEEQALIARKLAREANQTIDEIDRLILLKRSVKVCPAYTTWLELGKVELQLENTIDAAYAFENAVDFYRLDANGTLTFDQLQRRAIANGWLAETYAADGELALAQVATQEAVGGFQSLRLGIPDRLLALQARLDDAMSGADASVLARSFELLHQSSTRAIGVRPRVREEQPAGDQESQTLALMSDYTGDEIRNQAGNAGGGMENSAGQANTSVVGESRLNIPVLFRFDSAVLSDESKQTIGQLSQAIASLQLTSGDTLLLIGHTDSRGNASYNQDLSLRRAEAVSTLLGELLADSGYSEIRRVAEGHGESDLRYLTNDPDAHRRNRRVEVIVRR